VACHAQSIGGGRVLPSTSAIFLLIGFLPDTHDQTRERTFNELVVGRLAGGEAS